MDKGRLQGRSQGWRKPSYSNTNGHNLMEHLTRSTLGRLASARSWFDLSAG